MTVLELTNTQLFGVWFIALTVLLPLIAIALDKSRGL